MEDITVKELKSRLDSAEQIFLVDVREPHENAEFNIGGTLIPLGDIPTRLDQLQEQQESEIVVYCRSGQRSGMAKQFLTQAGYPKVRNLLGGMLAWQENLNGK